MKITLISMCVCVCVCVFIKSININVANEYLNDAMVLSVPLYGTISPCLCTRTFSRCSHACLCFLTILFTFVNGNTQSCSHMHRHFKYHNMFGMSWDGNRWRIHTNSRIDHALIDACIHTDTYRQSIYPHRPYIHISPLMHT